MQRRSPLDHSREIERFLRAGPMSAAQLMTALGVSQPTLSRTIQNLAHLVTSFRIAGQRTPRYALLRELPRGLGARQPIYRYLGQGNVVPFAQVEFLSVWRLRLRSWGACCRTR